VLVPAQNRYLVPKHEQFDVLGVAVAGELVCICRICRRISWYASEGS
jgi:hypothetical protein